MTAPRTYLVGLPVRVSVHDNGTVTYDLDPSDAPDAPADYDPAFMTMYDADGVPFVPSDEVLDADVERIRVALEQPWVRTPPR